MFDRVASLLTGHWKKVVGTLCALGLSACDSVPVTSMGSGLFGGPRVDVALLVPYGSAAATDTKIAQDLENAARLAIADQPDARLNLTVYPTGGTAGQASSAAQLAIAEGADVIVGPLYAEAANAAALASAARGVNVLAFSNNSTIAGGNLFILGATFENTAQRLLS